VDSADLFDINIISQTNNIKKGICPKNSAKKLFQFVKVPNKLKVKNNQRNIAIININCRKTLCS
jgi:hypothetical protein